MAAHWGAHGKGFSWGMGDPDDTVVELRYDAARIHLAACRLLGRAEAGSSCSVSAITPGCSAHDCLSQPHVPLATLVRQWQCTALRRCQVAQIEGSALVAQALQREGIEVLF